MSSQQSLASSSSSSSGMMADIEGGYRRPRRESEPGLYTNNIDHKKQGLLPFVSTHPVTLNHYL